LRITLVLIATGAVLTPVASFILAATISDRPYLMSARTMEKSRIALIPGEDVRRAFSDDREFATAIVVELAGGFRSAIRHAKDLKLRSSVERLANYLLRFDAQAGSTGSFDLPTEKRLLASLLGMTPENLSRAFAEMQANTQTGIPIIRVAKDLPASVAGLVR